MVIELKGLQYIMCDNRQVEKALMVEYRSVRNEDNTGYLSITAENLEKHTGIDQDNLELFFGADNYARYCQDELFPFIIAEGKMLFYSNEWIKYAKKVKLNGISDIKGLYYFSDELEQSLYAHSVIELFLILHDEPHIPMYYRCTVFKNDRGALYFRIILPSKYLGKDLQKFTREVLLTVNDRERYKPITVSVA